MNDFYTMHWELTLKQSNAKNWHKELSQRNELKNVCLEIMNEIVQSWGYNNAIVESAHNNKPASGG